MKRLTELLNIVENGSLDRIKVGSRLKFKNSSKIFYFKNWKNPNKRDEAFVTINNNGSPYLKKIANLTNIDTKPIFENFSRRELMKEIYILQEEESLDDETGEDEEGRKIEVLPRKKLLPLLEKIKGKIFTVAFVKKDGSKRIMNCRLGVKRHLKGGELPYDPLSKGLLPVFDMQKRQYRMINLMTIYNLKIEDRNFIVKNG